MNNSIKNLYLLYSKYSPICNQLIKTYPVINQYFKILCIDNEDIRKSILSSKILKVNIVPCMCVSYIDGNLQTFEGFQKCTEVINNILYVLNEREKEQREQRQPVQRLTEQLSPQHQTPIMNVIDKSSEQVAIRVTKDDDDESEGENNDEDNRIEKEKSKNREKLNRNRGIDSKIPMIKKGKGHEKMAKTSLPIIIETETENTNESKLQQTLKPLEPFDDIIDNSNKKELIKNDKKSIDNLKSQIVQMNKERESLIEQESKTDEK